MIIPNELLELECFTPPYEKGEGWGGIHSWVDVDKTEGDIDGFALCQADTPYSYSEGHLSKVWTLDNSYTISKIKVWLVSEMHIGGNILWTVGDCCIGFNCQLYKQNSKIDSGKIWEKVADAYPNYYWTLDEELICEFETNQEFYRDEQVEIRVTGYLHAFNDADGYASAEFDVNLAQIKVYGYQPDLIVECISINPPRPVPGTKVSVIATIKNQGFATAKFHSYSWETNLYLDGERITPWYLNNLEAGESFDFHYDHLIWPKDMDLHKLKVEVDSQYTVDESNENNNIYSIDAPSINRDVTRFKTLRNCQILTKSLLHPSVKSFLFG